MQPQQQQQQQVGMPQAPIGSQAAQVNVAAQAGTSFNIAICDSKDFPAEVAPFTELYSEFAMMDGTVLFECPGVMKATGIDLMNCPMTVTLQLRIRRRMPQGPMVLWHVVLPLPLISKHLMGAPHEWETWIGLLPNTQDLTAHPADMMFTQAVHLISRPEFPKLRLRFTYHNPQLQAQALAQQEREDQEHRRLQEMHEQVGRAQFQDIHKLMQAVRTTSSQSSSAIAASAAAAMPAPPNAGPVKAMPGAVPSGYDPATDPMNDTRVVAVTLPNPGHQPQQPAPAQPVAAQQVAAQPPAAAVARPVAAVQLVAMQPAAPPAQQQGYPAASATATAETGNVSLQAVHEDRLQEERLRDALAAALRFVGDVRATLASQIAKRPQESHALPMPLDSMEILAGHQATAPLDTHCHQLRQCLHGLLAAPSQAATPTAEVEPLLVEGLHMASLGMLDGSANDPARDELVFMSIRERFPKFFELCEQVSSVVRERGCLSEQQRRSQEQCRQLQEQCAKLSDASKEKDNITDAVTRTETQKQFEKLLNQQRQALQMNFDTETSNLRKQLDEMRRSAQEKENEVAQLRAQLGDFIKSRQKA